MPYTIHQQNIHGSIELYWAVWFNNTEYVFGTFEAAKRFAASHA